MNHELDSHSVRDAEARLGGAPSELVPAVARFLRVVRTRQRVVVASVVGAMLLGGVYCAFATRYYASSSKLLIVQQTQDQLASVGNPGGSDNTMATHRDLVASEVVLEEAIKRLAPKYRIDLVTTPPRRWVEQLKSQLSASTTRKTNIIEVKYLSRHPEAAAAVVRAVIGSYLDFLDRTHLGAAREVLANFTKERDELEADLAQKQSELQSFRQRVGHLSTDPDDGVIEPAVQRALHLNESLLKAQERRLELQAALASVDQAIAGGEDVKQHLAAIEATVGRQMLLAGLGLSPQDMQMLADQRRKLLETQDRLRAAAAFNGPNHPEIVQLKGQIAELEAYLANYRQLAGEQFQSASGSELGAIVRDMLEQAIAQSKQRELQLQASFDEARAAAAAQSSDLVQLQMLEREVSRLYSEYDVLHGKIRDVDMSQLQGPVQATVVRDPLPEPRPVSPQLRVVGVLSLFGGLVVGCFAVFVLDVLDDRFNSPEEIESQLDVPVLAMVRDMAPLEGRGLAAVHTNARPTDVEAEAFRTLRTSVTLSGRACQRIAVSSSEPGDGKTTITANLAVAFAQAGKKTLVIDADLRKPGFTALLDLRRVSGVADVLTDERPVEESAAQWVQTTESDRLDVLPAGIRRANPSELLSSVAFAELLAWADSMYDQVIVDCPPVLAVSDAQVAGRLVDGVILVVRPEKNHRRAVLRAVDALHATSCEVLGVVANGLSSESVGYGYGYGGYGYGYGYGYGHGHDDADDAPEVEAEQRDGFAELPAAEVASEPNVAAKPERIASPPDPDDLAPIRPRRAA